MKDYSAEHTVKSGEEFIIKLESNPTTGYSWHPSFDEAILELISHEFISRTKQIGARGEDRFDFKAIKPGITTIKMIYKRSWEKKIQKEKEFFICIT
jgi:inhibitor of cysteine peptidase